LRWTPPRCAYSSPSLPPPRRISCPAAAGGDDGDAEYETFKLDELKELLLSRKLATTGRRADLLQRLHDDDDTAKLGGAADAPAELEATAAVTRP